MAQNGSSRCDLYSRSLAGTSDRVAEVKFSSTGWTVAGYGPAYPPGGAVQTVLARITTTNGTTVADKQGRIGTGLIGDTGQTPRTCAATGLAYTEMTFGGSASAEST